MDFVYKPNLENAPLTTPSYLQVHYLPYFQPILAVASGEIAGYESLARCKRGDGVVESAGAVFYDPDIPSQAKIAIDRYVRETAISQFSSSACDGFLSLNIAPDWVDLLDENAAVPTITMIGRTGIDASKIVIEFTERSGDIGKLKWLRDLYKRAGLKVAIDDFGVGGSQVDRIIALRPDIIKLDMNLFKLASQGGPEADVVLSITAIAQRTGCEIICEGVETEEEFHFALECGADYIQGWLFSPATATTMNKDTFCSQVNSHKQNYLSRKSRMHVGVATHNQRVVRQVEQICNAFRINGVDTSPEGLVEASILAELGIKRIYICDFNGKQHSPNYTVSDRGIDTDYNSMGFNWCHRPYFPLLHAMHSINANHIVVSDPYKDALSGSMCKTLGAFISDRHVLLVDVLTSDGILFQKDWGNALPNIER